MLAAFMLPSASPVPTRLWTSSIKRMTLPSAFTSSTRPLIAAFKLAPELGARHQCGQVQQLDFLIPQLGRDLSPGDAQCQALGHGGFAHAGLADKAGVVLGAAREDPAPPAGFPSPGR